jgi:putative acetyltransferase
MMRAVIDLADKWLNLARIELTVFTDNEPAIALYRKFGFEIEARFANMRSATESSWTLT